jgi:hypothetical protein
MIKSLSGFDCFPLEMVGVGGKYKKITSCTRPKTTKMIESEKIHFSSHMVLKGPCIIMFVELLQLTILFLSDNLVSRLKVIFTLNSFDLLKKRTFDCLKLDPMPVYCRHLGMLTKCKRVRGLIAKVNVISYCYQIWLGSNLVITTYFNLCKTKIEYISMYLKLKKACVIYVTDVTLHCAIPHQGHLRSECALFPLI